VRGAVPRPAVVTAREDAGPSSWLRAAVDLCRIESGAHPLTPGRLVYLLKLKFGDGLRVAWQRDVVRPRILAAPPVRTPGGPCEIHVLTSEGDWLNLLWALHSFHRVSARSYALCIHDDGTLDAAALAALRHAFPDARLIPRAESDARVNALLAPFPRCLELRRTNTLAHKVLDFPAFLESDRMMILDSDVLFFTEPARLLEILETSPRNSLNRDWRYGYTIDLDAVAPRLDFELPALINSGLGLLHRASLRYDWMEEFLALPDILSHHHKIEQTLIALCSARFGYEMLPAEYDVHVGPRAPGVPSRHYTGPIRHLMYCEGVRDLVRAGFLDA
jgi:hypothetical protein